ncbi:MAG: porin [Pseudomonadota bacterium]
MRHQYHSSHFPRLAAAAVLMASCAAQAQDATPGPAWTFGGYGSLGVVHADYDQADFVSSILKPDGVGYTRHTNLSNDSRIAAQLGVTLDKKWSAVVQVLLERRYDYSYKPTVEWANVKYQVTPDLALRVGRIALPIFIGADYRKVGYAYPWVRTPVEVYGGMPITNSDGADISYRWRAFGMKHVTQAFYGGTDITLTDTTSVKASGLAGISHTAEVGALSVRASAFGATVNTNIARELFDGFRQFGPPGVAIADRYDVIDKRIAAATVGVNYDPGKWFLMSEIGYMNGHSFLAKSHAMYVSAGYRAGPFTTYGTYSKVKARDPNRHPGLSLQGLPPPYANAAMQLNGGLNHLLQAIPTQDTYAAGVRWDFLPSMALKLQYDHVTPRDGSRGSLINSQPGFRSGRTVHVTSAVLDFVF